MRLIISFLFSFPAFAQVEHSLVRRITVFPIKWESPELSTDAATIAEDAWWEIREFLTRDKRFLVASRNFLQQKDVYQARGELSPADAIILAKILDANAVVTTFVIDRVLHMRVYEGEYGRPLWEQKLALQPSLPVAQQLKPAALKLVGDFVAAVPYHGFVVVDPLIGQPVYPDGRRSLVKVEIGQNAELDIGDPAQFIRIYSDRLAPLFTQGASIEVFAEGRVVERGKEAVTIELDRLNKNHVIVEGTLVRLPRELKRLEQLYALQDTLKSKIDPEFFSPGMTPAKQKQAEKRPLIASLAFIGNIAAFLLLAF